MGDRLLVDLDALRETANELKTLAKDFRNASKTAADAMGAVGHDQVADALDEFTSNWRRHRDALVSSLDAVAQMARDSRATYVEADEELAAELAKQAQ